MPDRDPRPMDVQDQQRQAAREAQAQPSQERDKTIPGGRYILDDGETVVDAMGRPIKDRKD